MPKLRLQIDADSITLDDMAAVDQVDMGEGKWSLTKALLWRFLVDDEGRPLPEEQARQEVGQLSIIQANAALKALRAAFQSIREEALPPANGAG